MTQLYDAQGHYTGPSNAIEHTRIEYVIAGDDLFFAKIVHGRKLCVQGRAYRAYKLAQVAPPEQAQQYYQACAELFAALQEKIDEYTKQAFAYEGICQFGGQTPEIQTWPQCQCEGCQMIRADEDFQERVFEYAKTGGKGRQQPTGDRQRAA